jgi:hypothetical protein
MITRVPYGRLDKTTVGGRPRAPKNNTTNNTLSEDGTLVVRTLS